jgi:hypothetical protein
MVINNYSFSGAVLHVLGSQSFFKLRIYFTDITISVTNVLSASSRLWHSRVL